MRAFPYDFYHLWASAYVARLGGDPYDPAQIRPIMLEAGWPPAEEVSGFMHPFWSLAIFTPLSYLPFPIAALVWEVSILLLVALSVQLLGKERVRDGVGSLPTPPLTLLTVALFPPLLSTLAFGQTSALLLIGCAGWLAMFCQRRYFIAGALLSLTTLKPQLFIPLYLWIVINQVRAREHMTALGFVSGIGLMFGLSVAVVPKALLQWLAFMSSISTQTSHLPTPSFTRILGSLIGFSNVTSIALVVSVVLAVGLSALYRGRVAERAALFFLPFGFLATPYVWSHAFLVLLIPYLSLVAALERRGSKIITPLALLLAAWGIVETCYVNVLAPYSVFIPLVMVAYGARALSPREGAQVTG